MKLRYLLTALACLTLAATAASGASIFVFDESGVGTIGGSFYTATNLSGGGVAWDLGGIPVGNPPAAGYFWVTGPEGGLSDVVYFRHAAGENWKLYFYSLDNGSAPADTVVNPIPWILTEGAIQLGSLQEDSEGGFQFAYGSFYRGVSDVASTPEPATWLLSAAGLSLLARRRGRSGRA